MPPTPTIAPHYPCQSPPYHIPTDSAPKTPFSLPRLHISSAFLSSFSPQGSGPEMLPSPSHPLQLPRPPGPLRSPDRSCLMRPLLALGSTGRKSLNQVISGSGLPLAAQSIVAVRVRSTTFSWGPMSMLGKPEGSWSSAGRGERVMGKTAEIQLLHSCPSRVGLGDGPWGQPLPGWVISCSLFPLLSVGNCGNYWEDQARPVSLIWANPAPRGHWATSGDVHGCHSRHQVGGGQGCCSTPHSAQNGPDVSSAELTEPSGYFTEARGSFSKRKRGRTTPCRTLRCSLLHPPEEPRLLA